MFFIFFICRVKCRYQLQVLDTDITDTAIPPISGNEAAAISSVECRSERCIEGNIISMNLSDCPVEQEVSFTGFPCKCRNAATKIIAAYEVNPFLCGGATNDNMISRMISRSIFYVK